MVSNQHNLNQVGIDDNLTFFAHYETLVLRQRIYAASRLK